MGFSVAVNQYIKIQHLVWIIELSQRTAIVNHGLYAACMPLADKVHDLGDARGRVERFRLNYVEYCFHVSVGMSRDGLL